MHKEAFSMFKLRSYVAPDFAEERFVRAPDAVFLPAPADGVAPDGFTCL